MVAIRGTLAASQALGKAQLTWLGQQLDGCRLDGALLSMISIT
jgi:hypothetical protein